MAKKEHFAGGRIHRAEEQAFVGGRHVAPKSPPPTGRPPKKKKGSPLKVFLVTLMVLVLVVGVGFGALNIYLNSLLNTGEAGTVAVEHYTPKEYQSDVINILFVGIFREEGKNLPEGVGLTDVILYMNYDIKNNKLNMLQIPRDSYVGPREGSDGKINSLMVLGKDRENPINNLAACIVDQYKLPVDRYISLDIDGLKAIVDVFGSIRVYVEKPMEYGGSYLPQGWQWLDSNSVEFFVRNRKGPGFERSDADRLDNQRHFYSAIFRRFLNLSLADIQKLMPLFQEYCYTDIKTTDVYDLALTALKLEPQNIMICRIPGATGANGWNPAEITGVKTPFIVDVYGRGTEEEPGAANLLNQYFRTYGEPVPPEELHLPNIDIPSNVALYPVNVQYLNAVQEEEGGADIQVEPEQ